MKNLRFAFVLLLAGAPLLPAASPTLVWSDEFDQPENSAPDSAKWNYDLGAGGWGNNELETYTNSRDNAFVAADPQAADGRALVIRAIKTTGGYSSARLLTQGKFAARYGRIEARLKSTNGRGLWPAFWMLGENIANAGWPACGEIDIMEIVGANPTRAYGTLHGPGYSGSNGISSGFTLPANATYDTAYHVFAIDWSPEKIVWSVDGAGYHTVTPASLPAGGRWVFKDASFFLLLNLAVGGNWLGSPDASTVFPQALTVDYVRVYAQPPVAPVTVSGFAGTSTSATLSWTAAVNPDGSAVTGYRVERATDAAFTRNLVTFTVGAVTSFVDSTVAPGTAYFYRLVTLADSGASDPSASVTVSTSSASHAGASTLMNISARAYCCTGNNVTIGGFVVGGGNPKRILIRAVGPTLALAGLGTGELLADPVLELHQGPALIAINDNWETNANAAEIRTSGARVGALPFDLADHKSAALLLALPPGVYSFVVNGQNSTSGIVLLETYDAD